MEFEEIETREFTRAFNLPRVASKIRKFANTICSQYKLVLLMGMSCTGKSLFMEAYTGRDSWGLTKWNRDNILDMVFMDGTRVDKHYNYVDRFEEKILKDVSSREQHQIMVEGWNRMPSRRRHYLSLVGEEYQSVCIVFDGPVEKIVNRNIEENRLNMSAEEIELFIKDKYSGTVWPTLKEGWNDIFYINSFGEEGNGYLQKKLTRISSTEA